MSHLDTNLDKLKNDLIQMWNLVSSQMEKARLALINGDKDLPGEVRANEKMVDAFELKIDMDCGKISLCFKILWLSIFAFCFQCSKLTITWSE
ncbi:MAG: hypothetical protein U0Z17_10440 [Bacteroidales bacterium]